MGNLNYSCLFVLLFIFSAFASNVNFTYLNPSYQNDWGFIDSAQLGKNNGVDLAIALFQNDMKDVSINYIYEFDITDTNVKKDIESLKEINGNYEKLRSQRNEIIDKGVQIVVVSGAGTVIGIGALAIAFPLAVGVIFLEMAVDIYLVYDLFDEVLSYFHNYVELVRSGSNNYNSLLYKVEQNNNNLVNMGISNSKYRGSSLNDYSQTIYLINSIDSIYLIENENTIKEDIKNKFFGLDVASFLNNLNSQYYTLFDSQNSAHYSLIKTLVLQEKIKSNLINENNLLNSESEKLRKSTFDKLKYSTENFYNIDSYYILKFSLTSAEYAITPRDHVNLASQYYEEALLEIETAKKVLSLKNENYLVDSTIHFDNAITLFIKSDMELSFAQVKAQKIYSSATNYINFKYNDALIIYDSFVTYSDIDVQNKELASKYLVESKKLIESNGTHSQKILNLIVADSKIDSALGYLNPTKAVYDNLKADTLKSLDYLEKVIILAKKDKVDVSYEENYLKTSKNILKDPSISIFEMLFISEEVTNLSYGIYDKASVQYYNLNSKFYSLKSLISILNNYDSSLTFSEYSYLISFYGTDSFDKFSSLGNYIDLSSKVQILENKINLNKRQIVESMLIFNSVTSSNYYSNIELDVPSKLIITYSTYFNQNNLNYSGPALYEIPFNYDPYSANNITKSQDISLSYNNKKLSILINNFNSSKIYSLILNYDKIFAKTLSVKYSSIPISVSSVQINVEKQIENVAVSNLLFNKTNYEKADVYLNGNYYGQFEGKTVLLNSPLFSGKNTIKESYIFSNPLTYSVNEISKTSSTKKVKILIKNLIPFEMKNQPVSIDLPIKTPSSYSFSENTCNIDKNGFKFSSLSNSSKVFFVANYTSNVQCSFVIEFIGEYDKDKINDEIDDLLNKTDDKKTKDLLEDAKKDLDLEKINDALNNIEQAKDLIENEEKKNKELLLLELEYNATRDKLRVLINNLSKIENKKVSDIVVRAEKYLNEAETLTDVNKKILKIITVQAELDKLKGIGIDLKLSLMERSNKLIENWMDLVSIGFIDSIPYEIQQDLFLLNSIDFSNELSSSDFELLFSIENKLSLYESDFNSIKKDKNEWESELSITFKQLNTQLSELIKKTETSCGNDCPSDLILMAKSNLNLKPNDSYSYSLAIKNLNESIIQLNKYLDYEKYLAEKAFNEAKEFVSTISDDETRKVYLRKLSDIQSKLNLGNYLVVKKEAILLINSMFDEKSEFTLDNNVLLVGAGLGAILLAFIIIKIKSQNSTEGKEEEYKILKKAD